MSDWQPADDTPTVVPPDPDELRSGPTRLGRSRRAVGLALLAALVLAAFTWSVLTVRRGRTAPAAGSPAVTASAGPTGTPAALPTTAPSPGPVTLVAASGDAITVPVTAGWLPRGANRPVITNDGRNGFGTVTWWLSTGGDQIWLEFITPDFRGGLQSAMLLNVVPGVPADRISVDVNGHPATQLAMAGLAGAECRIGWQQQPELGVIVYSIRSGAPADHGCGDVARMARSVTEKAWTLAPAVRLGLVPAGYPQVFSAYESQAWCQAGAKGVASNSCVWLETDGSSGPPAAGSTPVTVHGRRAAITRNGGMTVISVPGSFSVSLPSARDDPSLTDLTDADLVNIAESVNVA